jgi:hypothetical protein
VQANSARQYEPDRWNIVTLKLTNGLLVPNSFVQTTNKKDQRERDSRKQNQKVGCRFVDRHFNRLNVENMDFSDIL